MENDLDKKLYNDYLNGKIEAFNLLYKKYKKKIEYFIFNIVHDYQKSEDLTQETFIYIMQNKMNENYSFKHYIYLKAKCNALNYIKVENRRNEISNMYIENNSEQIEKDILEDIIDDEGKEELIESIDLLGKKYKDAIYLTTIEGLSYKEASKILEESISNTQQLAHRGKKQLRNILIKKGFDEMNKITKVLIIMIIATTLIGGIVYATKSIYNDYIKRTKQIDTAELYMTKDGIFSWDFAEDMIHDEDTDLFYKIIKSNNELDAYKEKINELSYEEINFEKDYLLIVGNNYIGNIHERDLEISNIFNDENSTYIILKQKENPNYDKSDITLYAIVDKNVFKEDIKLSIDIPNLDLENYIKLEDLPYNYSVDDAIADGCFTIENNKIVSKDKFALDRMIENTKDGKNDFIRIYKRYYNYYNNGSEDISIIDIKYVNNIYMFHTRKLKDNEYNTFSSKYIHKSYNDRVTNYAFNNIEDNGTGPLLLIIDN